MTTSWCRRRRRRALLAAVLAGILVAAACSDGDGDEEGRAAGTTQQRSTTTTTTPEASDEEPDWDVIVPELYEKVYLLQARPNPDDRAAIEAVYAPTCECFADFLAGIENLAKNGWHLTGGPPMVVDVVVSSEDPGNDQTLPAFTLTVTTDAPALRVVDANGQTMSAPPPGRVRESILVIPDGPDRSWRIHDEVALPEG